MHVPPPSCPAFPQGGVSKATRGLHVSEDVLGGLNHVLRGGKVKYTEAISCGKGRDMGFNSVLQFELKISSGNAEVGAVAMMLCTNKLRLTYCVSVTCG